MATETASATRRITTKEAATHLGISHRTLEQLRWQGKGPPFYKIGSRVIYDLQDLDEWFAGTKRLSTADPGGRS